jgi:hypothetical protein
VIITIVAIVVLAVIVMISCLWLIYQMFSGNPDELREGHEVKKWKDRKAESSRKIFWTSSILTLALSAFLPITRTAFEIIYCSKDFAELLDETQIDFLSCETGSVKYLAYVLLAAFSLPFPIACYYVIQRNKPRGSIENPDITYSKILI